MSNMEIVSMIGALREWESIAAEAAAEVESIKDALKRHMDSIGAEELQAGTHIVRYATVLTNRFDSTAFKREHGELYKLYTKQSTSRRFTVSD